MDTPQVTKRLKAAELIMIMGPRAEGVTYLPPTNWAVPPVPKVEKNPRRISGADDPMARRVTLAIRAFHMGTPTVMLFPSRSIVVIVFFSDMIWAIAP